MFSPAFAPSSRRHPAPPGNAYRQVGVETGVNGASRHHLVAMLYDGVQGKLAEARCALRAGQIEHKAMALTHAVRIVDEGLRAALNPAGGELSEQLGELYAYMSLRLTQANLRNDESAIEECARLIEPLREAWVAIRPQVEAVPAR